MRNILLNYHYDIVIYGYTYPGISCLVQYSRGSFFPFFPFLPFGGCEGEENITKYMVKSKALKARVTVSLLLLQLLVQQRVKLKAMIILKQRSLWNALSTALGLI